MATLKVGSGFIYATSFRDSEGNYSDGGKNYYKVTLPNPAPATDNAPAQPTEPARPLDSEEQDALDSLLGDSAWVPAREHKPDARGNRRCSVVPGVTSYCRPAISTWIVSSAMSAS